jgi:hypothetical protein
MLFLVDRDADARPRPIRPQACELAVPSVDSTAKRCHSTEGGKRTKDVAGISAPDCQSVAAGCLFSSKQCVEPS